MPIKFAVLHSTLVAATAALAVLSTASAQTAQDTKNDMARCQQLYSTRAHYHANGGEVTGQDTEAEIALGQCRSGNYTAGVTTLEGLLKAKGIPVPPSETANAR